MTTIKWVFLFLIHSIFLQTADCLKHRKWKRWNEINVTFGTPMATLESVPLMNCLLRCEETAGCASARANKGTSTCELSSYYPPDGNLPATPRTGWTVHYKVRAQTKVLSVNNGGIWGEWGNPEYCPAGTIASGYIMKIEPKQFSGDDTSLNAIRLICSDPGGIDRGRITSLEGPFGSWTSEKSCTTGTYLVDFQLQVEIGTEKKTGLDNSCANYVKFHCRDLAGNNNVAELVLPPGTGFWGSWGSWSETCGPNSAICGLSARTENGQGPGFGVQGSDDDTALNDVLFYCCNDIY